ncbi:MAG: RNA polymerase subunit sigma [Planctomycetaceae bacterium]|nr:RNA polymerase subunit sigma [Planctomycetaceae bacterium]
MSDITRLLAACEEGEPNAENSLFDIVYDELRQMAAGCLVQERSGHSLQPTALVNEAYLRLFGIRHTSSQAAGIHFASRRHFFGAAANAMRRILVESARNRGRLKRGGEFERVVLDPGRIGEPEMADELLALDEALTRLTSVEPTIAELVRLRFFGGLTNREAAEQIGISPRTADSQWAYARAWLLAEMSRDESS